MQLTEAQRQAITYEGRNLQLIACAGSGKTEVVAQRVAHLLTKTDRERLEPRNIVAFTFTEKAAAELRERIVLRTKEAAGGDVLGMAEMYVGTIHGFCQALLQDEVPEYLKYEVLEPIRQVLYVNRNSTKTGLTTSQKLNGKKLRRWVDTGLYLSALGILREDNIDKEQLSECSVAEGLEAYRAQMAEDSYFDFSSMLENAVNELSSNDGLRSRVAERVKYVVVDEYQDVNPIQERLVGLLHDLGAGLCVVGDDDQTIYQWRGSSVRGILDFESRYPDVKQVRIEDNFRSSEGVIETAKEFVEHISHRLAKSMTFADAQPYESGDIIALHFDSPEEEAQYIVDTIRALHGVDFNDAEGQRGLSWSDMAILLRSVKHNGTVITDALKKAELPFVVTGLNNLFKTDEVCAARDIFYYIAGRGIDDDALRTSWEDARLGLDKAQLRGALRYAGEIRSQLQVDSGTFPTIQHVFLEFLKRAGMKEEKVPGDRGEVVMFNLGRFSQVVADWETIYYHSKPADSFRGFAEFLYYQADDAYSEGMDDIDYVTPDAVQVMTVHQAKGREWPAVFLPALLRNRFPAINKKSIVWNLIPRETIQHAERYDGSIDDERRLFYVAMTRSRKFLHMTWAPIEGKNNWYVRKSDFWDDARTSRWVPRRRPDYTKRPHIEARARESVANVAFAFSDLKYLHECAYQFKLRALCGFESPIVPPIGYGKSLHDALAEVHRRAMAGEHVDGSIVPELVERHLRTPYAFGDIRNRLRELAYRDLSNYIRDNAHKFR